MDDCLHYGGTTIETTSALLGALATFRPMAKAGGPYPQCPGTEPTSWEHAVDCASTIYWDVTPWLKLDKLMCEAIRRADALPPGASWISRAASWAGVGAAAGRTQSLDGEILTAMHNLFQKVEAVAVPAAEWKKVRPFFEDAMAQLFLAVGRLLDTEKRPDFPLLCLAAQVALDGYFPVDIEEREAGTG